MNDDSFDINLKLKNAHVIEFLSSDRVKVKFNNTGYVADFYVVNIKRGEFKDRLEPSVYGRGFGVMRGDYSKPSIVHWTNMMSRCYCLSDKTKSYVDCYVCDEWLNFGNFDRWFNDTHPTNKGVKFELDKDMKCLGNRVYSPDKCIWLPKRLNQYINDVKGASSITGVKGVSPAFKTGHGIIEGKYEVRCADGKGKRAYLGMVTCLSEGYHIYKSYKEARLKILSEEYLVNGDISKELFDIICNYKLEEM